MNDILDRIHQTLIRTVVKGLSDTSMVLKGGTALLLVYSLDRHSVDIDYDSPAKLDLPSRLDGIMRSTKMEYKIVDRKHTNTTSRVFIHYKTGRVKDGRLKIETKNNRVINPGHVHKNPGFGSTPLTNCVSTSWTQLITARKGATFTTWPTLPNISDQSSARIM